MRTKNPLTPLSVTAITNFLWAAEAFLAAGFLLGRVRSLSTAAGFWALAMLFMGIGALVGGIDHGFLEPRGNTPVHRVFEKAKNIAAGILAFFVLLTVGKQFFGAGAQPVFLVVGLVQLGAFIAATLLLESYLVVILGYAPAMILFLVMSILGLEAGTGSWQIIAGLLLSVAASVIQALGVDVFSPLDRNGLYHLMLMAATVFLSLGGLLLKGG
jgi:hypothetical protein